jgi:transcriptional regulator with XRE-family HTH domain
MTSTQADTTGTGVPSPRHNGIAIRCFREYAGYSQTAFAEVVGLTQGALSKIESEERSSTMITLVRIAKALSVPPAAILRDVAVTITERSPVAELIAS